MRQYHGLALIAEDGDNSVLLAAIGTAAGEKGGFSAPGGADGMPTIGPGESVTFTVTARPGDRLQIETMFVQSNDWFYAFGGSGLELFDGDDPVSGDVTSELVLYDAGTELDTAPGTGPDQAPVQAAPNTGDPGTGTIGLAGGVPIPATSSVLRVTVTPQT